MANRGRNIVLEIFKNFWQSVQPKQMAGNKIGTDYFGNTYYEIPLNAKANNRRRERWFTPKNKEAFDQEIPAEWESWLRGRRLEPPTEEEIEKSVKMMEIKRTNYAKLEAEYKSSEPKLLVEQKKTGYESFPKYDEYETSPGEKFDKKP